MTDTHSIAVSFDPEVHAARTAEPEESELMKSLSAVEKLSARKQKQVLEFIGVIAGKGSKG